MQEILSIIKSDEILEPETVRQVYPDITEAEFNKIMAIAALYKSRHFWENFYSFEDIVLGLNGVIPDFSQLQGATPEQIWYAIDLADKMIPGREYATEVKLYVKSMFNEVGVYIYPQSLEIENPFYVKAVELANNGPFPLGESVEEIQATKYLVIQEYIKEQGK